MLTVGVGWCLKTFLRHHVPQVQSFVYWQRFLARAQVEDELFFIY